MPLPGLLLKGPVQWHPIIIASLVNAVPFTYVLILVCLKMLPLKVYTILEQGPNMNTGELVKAMARLSYNDPGTEARLKDIKNNMTAEVQPWLGFRSGARKGVTAQEKLLTIKWIQTSNPE